MSGKATLTIVASRKASPAPSAATARTRFGRTTRRVTWSRGATCPPATFGALPACGARGAASGADSAFSCVAIRCLTSGAYAAHGAVAVVGDPDSAGVGGDTQRLGADRDRRSHHAAARRVDAGHRVVVAIRHPHRSGPGGDLARVVTHPDRGPDDSAVA